IDIGALDVSVMAGYPGTIAATWQRAGRAGRRSTRSAAVLVASSAPIDQFIVRHPSYFFDASTEHALINPDNLHILLDHVKCAAFELPFMADERFGQENVQEVLAVLAEEGFVHAADGQWNWTHESYPADAVSLRSVSSTPRTASASSPKPTSPAAPRCCTRRRSTWWKGSSSRWTASTSTDARPTCRRWTATTTPTPSRIRRSRFSIPSLRRLEVGHWSLERSNLRPPISNLLTRARSARTEKSTSCRASSGSRRSSSTPTRTSAPASSICPSSR